MTSQHTTHSSSANQAPANTADVELTPRERGFVARIMAKYPGGRHTAKDLYRSVVIISVLILAAHVIEQIVPAWGRWWLPLLIIYPPAIYLFTRYRKFGIFRSCIISKLGARLSKYEPVAPGRPPDQP
ncbi:MAG TPA: hypothetical protein PKG54_13170 [Phycisphaerae bacterium]|jgi:hypothetical protein|nr:hypothetical protein [Phycisphaerae bacterium]HOB75462.1 hypothetical protein [Phycisphaerae bacterium]HOJ55314.1 hypothetical protein [Phycisphaerae bacterium]HOL27398.1 hypothetical protein [Phycisphaerae bacterium]HPP21617.1 hypothetical protein [Phycisphaerae bacterium]